MRAMVRASTVPASLAAVLAVAATAAPAALQAPAFNGVVVEDVWLSYASQRAEGVREWPPVKRMYFPYTGDSSEL